MSDKNEQITHSKTDRQNLSSLILSLPDAVYSFSWKKVVKTRTLAQNKAIHKYCSLLAESLNAAGWSYWQVMNRQANKTIDQLRKELVGHGHTQEEVAIAEQTLDAIEKSLTKSEVSWNTTLVKEHLWKPIQILVINKESTTEADRKEYSLVYEELNRITASVFGVSVPFPSRHST